MTNRRTKRGLFITVEGVEGVGKTTNVTFIEQYIRAREIDLVVTREPGGTPIAESIRDILLSNHEEAVDPLTELLLVFASRAQHLAHKINPALELGQWVLSDRFTDATFAYQGGGRKLPMGVIGKLEHMVQKGQQPDKTFFLDLDVTIGLQRAQQRGELDRFEQEDIEFFENVRAAYWERIQQQPERFIIIDASDPLELVQANIQKALCELVDEALG